MYTPTEEQETIIRWCRDEGKATIYTSDTTTMTKLDKLVEASDEWTLVRTSYFPDKTIADKTYECPKKFISFRSKTATRNLTEEQVEAARKRMSEMRKRTTSQNAKLAE